MWCYSDGVKDKRPFCDYMYLTLCGKSNRIFNNKKWTLSLEEWLEIKNKCPKCVEGYECLKTLL